MKEQKNNNINKNKTGNNKYRRANRMSIEYKMKIQTSCPIGQQCSSNSSTKPSHRKSYSVVVE